MTNNHLSSVENRKSGIDILRILSMFAIVTLHCITHGGYWDVFPEFSFKYNCLVVLWAFSVASVDVYILISGYVNVKAKYKFSRIIMLWLEVVFYNSVIMVTVYALGREPVSAGGIISIFTPLLKNEFWFFTRYIMLFMLAPLLNLAAEKMSAVFYRRMLAVVFLLFCVVGMGVYRYIGKDIFILKGGASIVWFVALYMFGAYVRLHGINKKIPKYCWLILFCVSVVMICLQLIVLPQMSADGLKKIFPPNISVYYASSIVFIGAIALLIYFRDINVKSYRLKSFLMSVGVSTFGVYIIHDNPKVRFYVVNNLLTKISSHSGGATAIVFLILFEIVLFVVCLLIDHLRGKLFSALKIQKMLDVIIGFVVKKMLKPFPKFQKLYFEYYTDSPKEAHS